MNNQVLIDQLRRTQEFLDRSTSALRESDSDFTPVEGMYTAANTLAHIAHTVNWFMEGAFGSEGFPLDEEVHDAQARSVSSLAAARELVRSAFEGAIATLSDQSPESLLTPLPEGPVMGGAPRMAVVGGIEEHTAHHRGALSVYARLRGLTPPMPYM